MKKFNGVYLVGNYPTKQRFLDAAFKSLEFFDFLEVGIPFSDPYSDGSTIAKASFDVIQNGVKFNDIMESIDEIRSKVGDEKKIYVMTYANHIFHRGIENFADILVDHKINGMIIPDIPFAEHKRFTDVFDKKGLEFVYFITPESTKEQVDAVAASAKGFIYSVSIRGITGSSMKLSDDIKNVLKEARLKANVPVVLGFGIRDLDSCKNAMESSDGFIIGTKMIELLNQDENNTAFNSFIDDLKKSL